MSVKMDAVRALADEIGPRPAGSLANRYRRTDVSENVDPEAVERATPVARHIVEGAC